MVDDSSILLLPELMMRFCKVALAFKSVDQILSGSMFTWCFLFFQILQNEI